MDADLLLLLLLLLLNLYLLMLLIKIATLINTFHQSIELLVYTQSEGSVALVLYIYT